jgi:lipid II:glycine glycyltransferase (peptidoglycan interpeptide bridge formation enzyme)
LLTGLRVETGEAKGCSLSTFCDLPQLKAHGFFERLSGVTMMLDLTEGPDRLYRQFRKGRRSDIQYAIRSGVEIVEATSESDFEEYYRLHANWCARKNIQPHPREVMLRALSLRSNRRVFLAMHEKKVIAGTIIRFVEHGIAEYAANNSLEEFQNLRANPLLNWTAIQWAHNSGLKSFSMGGSHPYLRHFGGSEVTIRRYSFDATFLKLFRAREWLLVKRKRSSRD